MQFNLTEAAKTFMIVIEFFATTTTTRSIKLLHLRYPATPHFVVNLARLLQFIVMADDAQIDTLPLLLSEYTRYGRQMMLPTVGLQGQIRLKAASVLVVGAGGLGCPALLYLAGAGIGHLTIVDHDTVEMSNLHRQIAHTMTSVGMNKAESAKSSIKERNPNVNVRTVQDPFTPSSALSGSYDWTQFTLILDCTDNIPTRTLLNLISARYSIPLIFGAAIRAEGQFAIWNRNSEDGLGPCWRCIFPAHPSEHQAGRCEDEGVLGPIVGLVGVLMALETIKYITCPESIDGRLVLMPSFRSVKIARRSAKCTDCVNPEDRLKELVEAERSGTWTTTYCGTGELPGAQIEPRIHASTLTQSAALEEYHIIDVRPKTEFEICHLPGSKNIHLRDITCSSNSVLSALPGEKPLLLVCRQGNDSLVAARALRQNSADEPTRKIVDLVGGLKAYTKVANPSFPVY